MDGQGKPPVYMDRRNSNTALDKYVFISYSHKDSDFVYSDLKAFYDKGLRYWYDTSLESGDEWNNIALKKMNDPKCLGVIFYLSKEMLCSEAIQKEVESFCRIRAENPDFIFKIISVGGKTVLEHLRDFFIDNMESNCKDLENKFPQNRLSFMLDVFKSNVIFHPKNTPDDLSHVDKLMGELSRFDLFSTDESMMSKLVNNGILKSVNEGYVMELGSYPQEATEDVQSPVRDGEFTIAGRKYMASNWKVYEFLNIEWNLLSMDGDLITMVTTNCLDAETGSAYGEWLNEKFKETAFTIDESSRIIGRIRLMSLDEFNHEGGNLPKPVCTEYAKSRLAGSRMVVLWLDENIPGTKKRMCVSTDNVVLSKGMPISSNAGLRPVLTIKVTKEE